jgi:hypothetical protein
VARPILDSPAATAADETEGGEMSPTKMIRLLVAVAALVTALTVQCVALAASGADPSAGVTRAKPLAAITPIRTIFTQPAFKIEAVKLYAGDESGYDFLGSDEPMVVFTSASGNAAPITVATPEFSDVDSGETRSLNNLCVASCTTGFTAPTALSIQLFEMDQGSAESVRQKVEYAAKAIQWGSIVFGGSVTVPDSFIDYLTSLLGNDLMGSKTLRYDPQVLRQLLPNVGNSMTEKHHLGGHDGDLPWDVAGGPDYDLYLKITRLPNHSFTKAPIATQGGITLR